MIEYGFMLPQQIPPPTSSPKRLRKGFLVFGIILLIMGFFFFYMASRVNWDHVTTYKEIVNVGYPTLASNYGFGNSYTYVVNPAFMVQPNDFVTMECPDVVSNETVHIVLFENVQSNTTLLNCGTGSVVYTNHQSITFWVSIYLVIPANQNIPTEAVSTTTTLNHHETPQWVYLGVGAVLSSLALVLIFKSRTQKSYLHMNRE